VSVIQNTLIIRDGTPCSSIATVARREEQVVYILHTGRHVPHRSEDV
jgi:hypothetical protein